MPEPSKPKRQTDPDLLNLAKLDRLLSAMTEKERIRVLSWLMVKYLSENVTVSKT